ncbi:MAG: alpha/beta fold hydrolase [Chloroflexota bacterium]|nr:alpha/beta fold hydrolase [Chloroflexota bacterium]MDE2884703.1 alpha/beta fold hydrolase [Chloroflexota bacterium]
MPYEPSPFLRSLPLFTEDEHQPFRKSARGAMRGAALLVHGFPGTPADMRLLAASLASAGWDVDAPLLPGFGPQIITLPRRRYAEWRDVVVERVRSLREEHSRVIVLGHSLGAAVSVVAARREAADGYVLLAPYWRFGGPMSHMLWPLLRFFFKRWRPLRRADFADERIRNGLLAIIPDLQIDDPAVQAELRAFVVPTQLLSELRRLGIAAGREVRHLHAPTLVVQGIRDSLVKPDDTSRLVERLPSLRRYEKVDGSHSLPLPEGGAWERVSQAVLRFADEIASA